ncbi:MAG: hypothetical protein ABJG78_12735 [Cyclobacteriaceae bacterium]
MARQKGIIKLKGTIGDVSFYKSKDGYLAREKGGVDGDRIKNDPAFQRTRENGAEFGRAGKAGKILRNAFRLLLQNASDARVTSRLTKEMMRVIKTDAVSARGERLITNGNLGHLTGFDFNVDSKLGTSFYAAFAQAIDRVAGAYNVSIPAFVPTASIVFPDGATHYRFSMAAAEINFEEESFQFGQAGTAELELGGDESLPVDLNVNLTADSTDDLFLILGLEFFQEVNGVMYSLKNGAFNSLSIAAIDEAN